MPTSLSTIVETLLTGLPVLLGQFAVTALLLIVAVAIYTRITPHDERRLVAEGNVAAGVSLAGAMVALAIPLAATLATSHAVIDILVWGVIALLVQLAAFGLATVLMRDLRTRIEAGNVASAIVLAGFQFAVALLNAAAMAG